MSRKQLGLPAVQCLPALQADDYAKEIVNIIESYRRKFGEGAFKVIVPLPGIADRLQVDDVAHEGSSFIRFVGRLSDDEEAEVLQHVSQVNLLIKVTRA